ncbi:hypothetical protein ACFDTO_22055 [Microbacteriaceae bacterium 4G12]
MSENGTLFCEECLFDCFKTFFLGGREDLAMDRSGQGFFLPHAGVKHKEKVRVGPFLST